MKLRSLILATALLVAAPLAGALAQAADPTIAAPVLRANVTVTGDIVRIGDLIDNAGSTAAIPVYRAPDPGTTGSLPIAQVLGALRAHQVIGVDARDIVEVTVTRLARTLDSRDIETQVALALEHRNGLGDAPNIGVTLDRDVQPMQFDASNNGSVQPTSVRFDPRSGRFDVAFEIANDRGTAPLRLRFTGVAIETIETAVLTRGVERGETLKASDVIVERRPKADAGVDAANRDRAVGMQVRRALRAGQSLHTAELAKPDLVQRDQAVTLIYRSVGLLLTIRGKAIENGTEGDVVNVLNLQSKRTVSGVVTGRGEITVTAPTIASADAHVASSTPVSVATNDRVSTSRQTE